MSVAIPKATGLVGMRAPFLMHPLPRHVELKVVMICKSALCVLESLLLIPTL